MNAAPAPTPSPAPSVAARSASPQGTRSRRPTSTATFGSGRRESHDASDFYDRFVAPELSLDTTVNPPKEVDVIHVADARDMNDVASDSVALVVTSPPYFAGKQYEVSLGENGVPATYFEYLALLRDVFAECKRVLEPGGRIAVNVANLGRRPYRSLSGDVTDILSDLGLLLRGEVIWWKGRAAGGSCAWGTFQRPSNPVLRDVTERVVIASKGRFDRALKPAQRHAAGLPSTTTISRDEFMEATTDLWEIAPESARRVGHPAPFPIELPRRLIDMFTYEGDLVLDPFMGSGSTAIAAVRTGRHYLGFDTDQAYVDAARARVDTERDRLAAAAWSENGSYQVSVPAVPVDTTDPDPVAAGVRAGLQARDLAGIVLESSGFTDINRDSKPRGLGITLDFVATDANGGQWAFDVSGAFTTNGAGLRRTDALWKALGKAAVLHQGAPQFRLVLLTTAAPVKGTPGFAALEVVRGPDRAVFDVVELLDPSAQDRLRSYAVPGHT